MLLKRSLGLLSLLAVLAGFGGAEACSVTRDYVQMSNFELVQNAEAIVVATAVSETRGDPKDFFTARVRFRVDQVWKGRAPKTVDRAVAVLGAATPSDPGQIAQAHPEALGGACYRTTYAKGRQYLLFLRRDTDGSFTQAGGPFTRESEDYAGEDSLWARTVRAYLDIQKDPDGMARIEALKAFRDRSAGTPLAADIDAHLAKASPWKPTAFLVDAYERGTGDRAEVLQALALGDHRGAAPLFERIVAAPGLTSADLGQAIRYFANNGAYRRALELTETRALAMLPGLPWEDAYGLLGAIYEAQGFGETAAWRADPYGRTAWPELALRLYDYEDAALNSTAEPRDPDWIRAIPVTDFRARPRLTLALAATMDDRVEAWAIQALAAPAPSVEDAERLPLMALVRGFGAVRDRALGQAWCAGGDRRALLLDVFGEVGRDADADLIARMAAGGLSDTDRPLAARALSRIHGRVASRWGGGETAFAVMGKVMRGERIEAERIGCS